MNESLTLRLIVSASIVLAAFFGIAGAVLESAFKDGVEQAMRERLQVHIYALLSAADLTGGHLDLPSSLPEARFSQPGSGLYGAVFDSTGKPLWQSPSAISADLKPVEGLQAGQPIFSAADDGGFVLFYPVVWENEQGWDEEYLFVVAEDADALVRQVTGFRTTLWRWLGGIGFMLVVIQAAVLGWSLRPLRSIAKDLEAIESGERSRLNDRYPRELQGLAGNMNALLDSERAHLERYRNTLSNLAHSLKTPLSILRGCCNDLSIRSAIKTTMSDQVSRMDDLIEYQLQRAAARGRQRLSDTIAIVPVIEKILAALDKVHASKGVISTIHCENEERFLCEEGDFFEIAGNLIDNAYKWCNSKVDVTVQFDSEPCRKLKGLRLIVEDDGPGIPKDKIEQILCRGVRTDERIKGHGIGLAIVTELVQLSGGRLEARTSQHGGARWDVWLPGND